MDGSSQGTPRVGRTSEPPISYENMFLRFTVIDALMGKEQGLSNMISHAFSHQSPTHLAGNMLGLLLCTMNVPLSTAIAGARFIGFFLCSALGGQCF